MSDNKWKKEICTIPNLLSLFRLLLIPIYLKIYLTAEQNTDYILAGSILALSCLTDLADGIIARQLHMISNVGKVLDPLADKLTQFFLLLSLSQKYKFLYQITALFFVKEIFQLSALVIFARNGKALTGALTAGKLCTASLFISLTALVLFPNLNRNTVYILITTDALLLFYSFCNYFLAYFGKNTKLTDLNTE